MSRRGAEIAEEWRLSDFCSASFTPLRDILWTIHALMSIVTRNPSIVTSRHPLSSAVSRDTDDLPCHELPLQPGTIAISGRKNATETCCLTASCVVGLVTP